MLSFRARSEIILSVMNNFNPSLSIMPQTRDLIRVFRRKFAPKNRQPLYYNIWIDFQTCHVDAFFCYEEQLDLEPELISQELKVCFDFPTLFKDPKMYPPEDLAWRISARFVELLKASFQEIYEKITSKNELCLNYPVIEFLRNNFDRDTITLNSMTPFAYNMLMLFYSMEFFNKEYRHYPLLNMGVEKIRVSKKLEDTVHINFDLYIDHKEYLRIAKVFINDLSNHLPYFEKSYDEYYVSRFDSRYNVIKIILEILNQIKNQHPKINSIIDDLNRRADSGIKDFNPTINALNKIKAQKATNLFDHIKHLFDLDSGYYEHTLSYGDFLSYSTYFGEHLRIFLELINYTKTDNPFAELRVGVLETFDYNNSLRDRFLITNTIIAPSFYLQHDNIDTLALCAKLLIIKTYFKLLSKICAEPYMLNSNPFYLKLLAHLEGIYLQSYPFDMVPFLSDSSTIYEYSRKLENPQTSLYSYWQNSRNYECLRNLLTNETEASFEHMQCNPPIRKLRNELFIDKESLVEKARRKFEHNVAQVLIETSPSRKLKDMIYKGMFSQDSSISSLERYGEICKYIDNLKIFA